MRGALCLSMTQLGDFGQCGFGKRGIYNKKPP